MAAVLMPFSKKVIAVLIVSLICFYAGSAWAQNATTIKSDPLANLATELATTAPVRYFGLYFQGNKVGWMSTRRERMDGNYLRLTTKITFALNVGGNQTRMATSDIRDYSLKDGKLLQLHYAMGGSSGETKIVGQIQGDTLFLESTAGGHTEKQSMPFAGEKLEDVFAAENAILTKQATPGVQISIRNFDPSLKRSLVTEMTFKKSEERPMFGVPTTVFRVDGQVRELGIPVVSWYDKEGNLIETMMAGFLKARWEDEQQAKSGFSMADFLESSKVSVPSRLADSRTATRLVVTFSGLTKDMQLPTRRQTWTAGEKSKATLTVTKEAIAIAQTPPLSAVDPARFANELAPESRLQSDTPEIKEKAKEITAGIKRTGEAAQALMRWVYQNVTKRYTPTFSNAAEVMKNMAGDCGEHAVLFVALARAAGLPAREVTGIVYSSEMNGFYYHAWAEVWMGDWVSVDPSWGQIPADPTHIAFAKGGMAEQVRIISLFGRLTVQSARLY